MLKLKKLAVALTVIAGFNATNTIAQEYMGSTPITRIRIHPNGAYVGTARQPDSTCSNFGEYFKFDHTTPHGKSLLATLLTAKAADKNIEVWFTASPVPKTDNTNGCTDSTTAILTGVSLPN